MKREPELGIHSSNGYNSKTMFGIQTSYGIKDQSVQCLECSVRIDEDDVASHVVERQHNNFEYSCSSGIIF